LSDMVASGLIQMSSPKLEDCRLDRRAKAEIQPRRDDGQVPSRRRFRRLSTTALPWVLSTTIYLSSHPFVLCHSRSDSPNGCLNSNYSTTMSEDDDLGQLLLDSPSSFHRSPPPAAHTDRILLSSSTAAIRARRLAQLQSSGGGGGGPSRGGGRGPSPGGGGGGPGGDEKMSPEEQAAQKAAEEEQMRTIMATVLEPGARERRSSLPSRLFFLLPSPLVSSFSFRTSLQSLPHLTRIY
jgi:hypothetical protein